MDKINKQNRNAHRHREQTDTYQRVGGLGDIGEEIKQKKQNS